jgi:hypothetical protein
MNQQAYDIADAPAQRVIEDVLYALRSLKTISGQNVFNTVLPAVQYSFAEGLEDSLPAAFVYFGEEAEGYNTASQFDEMYFYPFLEVLFLLYIPNNNDGSYPDVHRYQLALHNLVIQNLRVPTDDILNGIPFQKNITTGKELWEFREPEEDGFRSVVSHRFDVRNKWIENGRPVKDWFYLSSIRIRVQVNNINAES